MESFEKKKIITKSKTGVWSEKKPTKKSQPERKKKTKDSLWREKKKETKEKVGFWEKKPFDSEFFFLYITRIKKKVLLSIEVFFFENIFICFAFFQRTKNPI